MDVIKKLSKRADDYIISGKKQRRKSSLLQVFFEKEFSLFFKSFIKEFNPAWCITQDLSDSKFCSVSIKIAGLRINIFLKKINVSGKDTIIWSNHRHGGFDQHHPDTLCILFCNEYILS